MPHKLLIDRALIYKGNWSDGARCWLRVYAPAVGDPDGRIVVVFTEMPDNDNTSVTNRIEHLAEQVRRTYIAEFFDTGTYLIVEHYPGRRVPDERMPDRLRMTPDETFALVRFSADKHGLPAEPQWQHVRRAKIEALIDGPFIPVPGCEAYEMPVREATR